MGSRYLSKTILVIGLLVMIVSVAVPLYLKETQQQPTARQGVIDLTDWDFQQSGPVKLDGEWLFYWDEYADPSGTGSPDDEMFNVPGSWFIQKGYPIEGKASYRLKILLPPGEAVYGFKTENIRNASRLYANGQLIGQSGVPGESRDNNIQKNAPYTAMAALSMPGMMRVENVNGKTVSVLDVVVHVGSFRSHDSGIYQSIHFGDYPSVMEMRNRKMMLDAGISMTFFFSCLYFLAIYFQRSKLIGLLFFGAFSFSFTIYYLTHSERLLLYLMPEIPFHVHYVIQNLSGIFSVWFSFIFLQVSTREMLPKAIRWTNHGVHWFFAVMITVTDFGYSLWFTIPVIGYVIWLMACCLYLIVRAVLKKVTGSDYLMLAFAAILCQVLLNLSHNLFSLEEDLILPVYMPILLIATALFLAERFNQSYEKIESLTNELKQVDRLKDEFLAKTSHELRTPLNGIINLVDSILQGAGGQPNQAHTEDLQLVRSIGKRLLILINDLLDFAKVKNNRLHLQLKPVDLHPVVVASLDLFRLSTEKNSIHFRHNVQPNRYIAHADENRIFQVIYNLLDNAVKHAGARLVEVEAVLVNDQIRLTVSDDGKGLPEYDAHLFFESLEKAEPLLMKEASGNGLGLIICKQIVELHDGQITLEQNQPQGTKISFFLPVSAMQLQTKPVVTEGTQHSAISPSSVHAPDNRQSVLSEPLADAPHVLIVDDEWGNRKSLINILQLEGYRVDTAEHGGQAMLMLEHGNPYDLIIMDVMMPGSAGYEICAAIRKRYSPLELPVLMITAHPSAEVMQICFANGANDFIEKPYDRIELLARAGTLVHLKRAVKNQHDSEMRFLQAQIKPHFIFNTLTTIISFHYIDKDRAVELLRSFSTYLRGSFQWMETDGFAEVSNELAVVQAYIDIETARHGDRLQVDYELSPDLKGLKIPVLSVQTLVENAIMHGLKPKAYKGKVVVRIQRNDEHSYRVEVTDDGIGMNPSTITDVLSTLQPARSVGLYNLQSRIMRMTGKPLMITSAPGDGTSVSFTFPVKWGNPSEILERRESIHDSDRID